jgi:hypothetical protein
MEVSVDNTVGEQQPSQKKQKQQGQEEDGAKAKNKNKNKKMKRLKLKDGEGKKQHKEKESKKEKKKEKKDAAGKKKGKAGIPTSSSASALYKTKKKSSAKRNSREVVGLSSNEFPFNPSPAQALDGATSSTSSDSIPPCIPLDFGFPPSSSSSSPPLSRRHRSAGSSYDNRRLMSSPPPALGSGLSSRRVGPQSTSSPALLDLSVRVHPESVNSRSSPIPTLPNKKKRVERFSSPSSAGATSSSSLGNSRRQKTNRQASLSEGFSGVATGSDRSGCVVEGFLDEAVLKKLSGTHTRRVSKWRKRWVRLYRCDAGSFLLTHDRPPVLDSPSASQPPLTFHASRVRVGRGPRL